MNVITDGDNDGGIMDPHDGRNHHFLATAPALYAIKDLRGRGFLVWPMLAFGLDPKPNDVFPLLVGEAVARILLAEFEHDDVQAVLQHSEGQRLEHGVPQVCRPPWMQSRFGSEADAKVLEIAHIEPYGRGESLRLTCEGSLGRIRPPISALAGRRLIDGLEDYLQSLDWESN